MAKQIMNKVIELLFIYEIHYLTEFEIINFENYQILKRNYFALCLIIEYIRKKGSFSN